MRASGWFGIADVRVEPVPNHRILNPRDAIIRVTLTAICGSARHLYPGVSEREARRGGPPVPSNAG